MNIINGLLRSDPNLRIWCLTRIWKALGGGADPLAILFDLDGTLHDRRRGIIDFASNQFFRLGVEPHYHQKYVDRFVELDANGMVWKDEVYRSLSKEFDLVGKPSVEDLVSEYLNLYPRFSVEVSGAKRVLGFIRAHGAKVCILTNGRSDLQRAVIDALGFSDYLDAVVISEEVGVRKPQREIFELALDALGVKATDAVMIGDSIKSDVEGALSAGLHAIAFACSSVPEGTLLSHSLTDAVHAAFSKLGATAL